MLQLHLLIETSGNMFIVIFCALVCDVINFEISFSFLVKPFSCIIKEVRIKTLIYYERKELFRRNKKHSSFLKGFN